MVTFGTAESTVSAEGLQAGHVVRQAGILSADALRCREQSRDVVPSGCPSLDALLPAGGVRRGSLIEWLGEQVRDGETNPLVPCAPGVGAVTLACAVARGLAGAAATSSGGVLPRTVMVVDRTGWFHPPAVLPWLAGLATPTHLVVARPSHDDDEIWAIDQALRCPGVAAVVAWPRVVVPGASRYRSSSDHRWRTAMRRWQLAARASGAVGLIVRQGIAHGESSWAEARLAVSSLPSGRLLERRLRVRLIGGTWSAAVTGGTADIVLDLVRGAEGHGHERHERNAAIPTAFQRRAPSSESGVARATA